MNILFFHPNYPAQFRHIVRSLAQKGHRMLFLTANGRKDWPIPGVEQVVYQVKEPQQQQGHLFQMLRRPMAQAEAVLKTCMALRKKGFIPQVIYGASGWGGTWFLRDIFPKARIAGYFEWYYDPDSADTRFDGTEPTLGNRVNLRLRNTVITNDLLACDLCITPSEWQKSQFPHGLRERLTVLHDGIDTSYFCPAPDPRVAEPVAGLALPADVPLITYATRGMEPYRGFPQFMQAMGTVLSRHPTAHVAIAGEDRVCYGSPRQDGKSWKEYMLSQVALPPERVHFLGSLPYGQYRQLLRRSNAHVYLTRPFVLSWSLLEALSCGCLVVAADTGPVREVMTQWQNGLLTDFFLPRTLAKTVLRVLEQQDSLQTLRRAARQSVVERYELSVLLPRLEQLLLGEEAGK